MSADSIWMTLAAKRRLEAELADLENLADADADTQVRIRELRHVLRNAEVDQKPDDGLVEPGMRVSVQFERDGSRAEFLFGDRSLSALDPALDTEVYSPTSPLGSAINGHYVGDTVAYESPGGQQQITIISAAPFE